QMLRLADVLDVPRVPELVGPKAAPNSHVVDGGNFALVHATPMFAYKEWTPQGWRALASGLAQRGLPVVAIGGPGDSERRYLDAVWNGVTAIHQVEWPEMMQLLKRARVYIGPDTSVTHFAAGAPRLPSSVPPIRASGDLGRSAALQLPGMQALLCKTKAMSGSCRIPCRACRAHWKVVSAISAAAAPVLTN